jgi:hypothetical protein
MRQPLCELSPSFERLSYPKSGVTWQARWGGARNLVIGQS